MHVWEIDVEDRQSGEVLEHSLCLGVHMLPWATVVDGPLTVWEGQPLSLVLV